MRCIVLASCAWVAMALGATPAGAIVMRHDRPDEAYRKAAAGFDAVGALSGSAGTLVAPQWVLTAGHVAAGISPLDRTIRFGRDTYTITAIVHHPSWTGASSESSVDMALLMLDRPVRGIEPAGLYDGDDEVGKQIWVVGEGQSGDGRTGPQRDDRIRRAGTNVIDGIMAEYLLFAFDAPPAGTDLEGISGPGDSGGPALIRVDGALKVVGVSSGNDGRPPCRYGSREGYARVSTSIDWIRRTLTGDPPKPLPWAEPVDVATAGWPESALRPAAEQLFRAFASGRREDFETLERGFRAAEAAGERPLEARVDGFMRLRERTGGLTPRRAVADGADLLVMAEAAKPDPDGRRLWVLRFVGAGERYESVRMRTVEGNPPAKQKAGR